MKKTISIVILLILCLGVIIACCACDFEKDGIEVTFYSTMGKNLEEVTNRYTKEFNKIYPDIKIKHVVISGDYNVLYDRIGKELEANSGPALAYCYADHVATYNETKKVVALDSFINSKEVVPAGKFGNEKEYSVGFSPEEIADFVPGFYQEGKTAFGDGSTMYTLPFAKSSEVMFYNVDAFNELKLVPPTHWWCDKNCPSDCTTSMEYVCQTFKNTEKYKNSIPFGYDADDNFFITMCEQLQTLPENEGKNLYTSATGKKYLFNNDEVKNCILKLNQWYKAGYFITKATNGNAYTSDLFKFEDSNIISQGKQSFMGIGSTGGATYNIPATDKFKVGVAPIPQMNPSKPKVISQGPNLCMLFNKNNMTSDQQLAAWLYMKFLTTNLKLQASFSMASGYTPVIQSVQNDPIYRDEYLNNDKLGATERISAAAVKQCLQQVNSYYVSPAFYGSSTARQQAKILFSGCMEIKLTDEALINEINEKFKTAIAACEFFAKSDV